MLPKQITEHGLKKSQLKLNQAALEFLIDGYTRESGVRGLEKAIAKVVRNAAKHVASKSDYALSPSIDDLLRIMGPKRINRDKYQGNDVAGVVTGLAWTPVGGDILFIESSLSRGEGKLSITGNLGDVMKESATIALAYIKSHADELDIPVELFKSGIYTSMCLKALPLKMVLRRGLPCLQLWFRFLPSVRCEANWP